MNKSYRLIYNDLTNTWVAVSEAARGRGKRSSGAVKRLALGGFLGATAMASVLAAPPNPPAPNQLPTGGQVVAGQASISQSAATLTVNQSSNRAAVDWQTFNVGSAATVNFKQPSAASVTLNRVQDANPSQIFGRINANGQVFLSNPNGVFFAPGASVDVGALVATTHRIGLTDFMAGNAKFERDGSTGSVVNEGELKAALGGYIALLAPEVRNSGVIVAQAGTVALASGEAVTLHIEGSNSLAGITVQPSLINALVENKHVVLAPGGLIILSAKAAALVQGGVIKNSGHLEATGLVNDGGRVMLEASDSITHSGSINADAATGSAGHGGTVTLIANLTNPGSTTTIDGSISVRGGSLGGDGGFVETSATHVNIADTAKITSTATAGKAGTWLLDPFDFTIAATGGNISGAALTTALGLGAVTIQTATGGTSCTGASCTAGSTGTAGNINVNEAVSWSANQLTLNAYNNININANLNASSTASLALLYGQSTAAGGTSKIVTTGASVNLPAGTANFTTKLGSSGAVKAYKVITSLGAAGSTTTTDLQGMNGGLALNYALGADINASTTSTWNFVSGTTYSGFAPIGASATPYTGIFDGLGHTITGLTINRASTDYVGLFGSMSAATVRNVGLLTASVTGRKYDGGLAGSTVGASTIGNSYVQGTVIGTGADAYTGGLVGALGLGGTISDSYHAGSVIVACSGCNRTGGLVGDNAGTIANSYHTGSVSGAGNVGGLAGVSWGPVSNSYATGTVTSTFNASAIGGLVGNSRGAISNSYSTATVSQTAGGSYIGGLVGGLWSGSISSSYATGNVSTSGTLAGGLMGAAEATGSVSDSYATGNVSGTGSVGGLVGSINAASTFNRTYATGAVAGTTLASTYIGGLVGQIYSTATVKNSYATGSVNLGTTNSTNVGGLVGGMTAAGTISNSYATGAVTGNAAVGGLIGTKTAGTVTNNFWDVTKSGKADGLGIGLLNAVAGVAGTPQANVTGLTTTQMTQQASFSSWNTATPNTLATTGGSSAVWRIYEGHTAPLLRGFLTPLTLADAPDASLPFNGTTQNGASTATAGVLGAAATGTNMGFYNGYYSTQKGYDITGGNLTITPVLITISLANSSMTYGSAYPVLSGYSATNLLGGDSLTGLAWGSAATQYANAGTYAYSTSNLLTPTFSLVAGHSAANYLISWSTNALTINPAPLTVSGTVVANKVYNGTTPATLSGGALVGVLNGDAVTLATQAGAFTSKNVGIGVAVTAADTLGGAKAGNYTLTQPAGLTGNITAAPLTVTGTSVANKVYDATTTATLSGGSLSGVIAADAALVSLSQAGTFDSASVGTGKAVTAANSLSGAAASNYSLTQPAGLTANITKAPLTITANSDAKFVGQTDASGFNGASYTGLVGGETSAVLGGALTMTRSNAGTNAAASYAGVLVPAGLTSGNYTLSYVNGNFTIVPAGQLLVSVANTETTYGATPSYNITSAQYFTAAGTVLNGTALGADLITTLTQTANTGNTYTWVDGLGGSATFTLAPSGASNSSSGNARVGNYAIAGTNTSIVGGNFSAMNFAGNLSIAQKSITPSVASFSKTYDGTTAMAGVSVGLTGKLTNDAVTASGVGTFASKNAGTGLSYAVSSVVLAGADAGNYSLSGGSSFSGSNGTITPAVISAVTGISASNKTYDAGTVAVLNTAGAGFTGKIVGDTLSVATASGAFVNKDAATGKTVNISGITLGATDALNYTLAINSASSTANITAASLAVTGVSANNKVYDATLAATLSGTATVAALGSDGVTVGGSASAAFASKGVGTAKAVTVSGYTLGGADAGNYTVVQPTGLTANIAAAQIAIGGVTASNKVYDATTSATVDGTAVVTALGSDVVNVTGTGSGFFVDKNVGTAKAVAVSGFVLGGADAGNYTAVQPVGVTANITAAPLAITGVSANNKVYDASTAATLGGTAAVAALGSDVVVIGSGSGVFADKDVGTGKAVTASGFTFSGADAGNYTIVQPAGITANITAAPLTVKANADSKFVTQVDAVGFNGVSYNGFVGGETSAVLGGALTMSRSNAATNGAGTYTGVLVPTGYASSNYTLSYANGDYTIVPAQQLLVKVANTSTPYGTAPTYTITSAQYLTGASVLTSLTQSSVSGNTYTWSDTAGGSATFTLVPSAPGTSTSGNISVGNYALTGGSTSIVGGNFSALNFAGNLSVTQKATSASVGNISKAYDGTTAMAGVTVGLTGTLTNDVVTANGVGTFSSKNAGINLSYSLNNITLAGADAGNYYLAGGSSVSGANGVITQAPIGVSTGNVSKTYDGTLGATGGATVVSGVLFAGDSLSGGTFAFTDKNVGSGNKSVTPTGVTVSDGTYSGNYAISYVNNTASTISAAPLTLTPVVDNKVYDGTVASTATVAITGIVASDNITVAQQFGSKNVQGTNLSTLAVKAGYTILDGSNADMSGNYAITDTATAAGTINKAHLTVTADNQTRLYGAANPTLTSTVSGFVNGEVLGNSGVTGSGSGTTSATTSTGVGTAQINATAGTLAASNYDFNNLVAGTLSIDKAPLSVTANAASKTYDGVAYTGGNGVVYSGFVNSETSAVLGGSLGYAGTSQGAANVGNYVITPNGLTSANYSVSFVDGSLTINAAALSAIVGSLTINAAALSAIVGSLTGNTSKVYDGTTTATLTPGNYSLSGFAAGEGANVTKTSGTFDTANAGTNKTVTVTLSNSDYSATGSTALSNYTLPNTVSGNIGTITKAPLSVTANNASKTYDGVAYTGGNGVAYSGFVNSETNSVLGGTLGYAGSSQGATNAGNYVITPNGLTSANYSVSFVDGSLTINAAALRAIVGSLTGNTSKVYDGTTTATLTPDNFSLTGFATGEGASVNKTTGTFDTAAAGTGKTVTVSLSNSDYAATGSTQLTNYTLPTTVSGNIGTISKAHLTVTADNQSRLYGQTNPTLTETISGFVNGETLATSGVTGAASAVGTTAAVANTPVGSAAIAASTTGLLASNYDFTASTTDGTLTILTPIPAAGSTIPVPLPSATLVVSNSAALAPTDPVNPTSPSGPAALGGLPASTLVPTSTVAETGRASSNSSSTSEGESAGSAGGANRSGISVNLTQMPTAIGNGLVAVSVSKDIATSGTGFSFALPTQVVQYAAGATMEVTTLTGQDLPAWLKFVPESNSFVVTAVPDGGFPFQVLVVSRGQRTVVVVSERKE